MVGGNRKDFFFNTLNERCFMGGGVLAAVAANYSILQLWNPAGSDVMVVLQSITGFGGASPDSLNLFVHNAALAGGVLATSSNKYVGGAAPSAEIRWANAAAIGGTKFANFVLNVDARRLLFTEPIIIPAGQGVTVCRVTLNVDNSATFEWIELPV